MSDVDKGTAVAILGWPNSGKSTLINRWLGRELSITSHKPQTTRWPLLGRLDHPDGKTIAFIDTPGINHAQDQLSYQMRRGLHGALEDASAILILWDATVSIKDAGRVRELERICRTYDKPLLLAINKIDCVPKASLLELAQHLHDRLVPKEVLMICAKSGDGCADLLKTLYACLDFEKTDETHLKHYDQTLTGQFAEITRNVAWNKLKQELPYGMTVKTNRLDRASQAWHVYQHIVTNHERHKAMLIGRRGAMIKQIGQQARHDMQKTFKRRIHLHLEVKVEKDWPQEEAKKMLGQQ